MVSLKQIIVRALPAGLLLVGVVIMVLVCICRLQTSCKEPCRRTENARWQPAYLEHMRRSVEKPSRTLDPKQRERLASVVEKLSLACRKRQVLEISQVKAQTLVSMADGCSEATFYQMFSPLVQLLERELCEAQSTHFKNPEDLRDALETRWAAVRLLGETLLARQDFDGPLMFLEAWFLRMLTQTKAYYESQGLLTCVNIVGQANARLLSQIESEKGFTRLWLRREMNNELWLVQHGIRSVESLSERARTRVRLILDLGYTPKWLDKDYPPLPEDATKEEANLPE